MKGETRYADGVYKQEAGGVSREWEVVNTVCVDRDSQNG